MTGRRAWLSGLAAGAAVAYLVGGAAGVACGAVAAAGGIAYLRRQELPAVRRARERALADLPIAADLVAAALRAGTPPDRAAAVVGEALGGPVGERLALIAADLRRGAAPPSAWSRLADVPGGERLARAAARSADRGTALTRVFEQQAVDLRAVRADAAQARVRRLEVLVIVPLGVCYLPAFLLVGIVPVVVSVLGDVLGHS
jgi:pilus assembly protein TadC